jgi:signal transduction histidine kinase
MIRIIESKSYWRNISAFSSEDYEILIYQNDSLVFWSQNLVIPGQRSSESKEAISFQKFRNGYFIVVEKVLPVNRSGEIFHVSALVPVKYSYETSNSYLKPHFNKLFDLENYFLLSKISRPDHLPVNDLSGKPLFYVGIDPVDYSGRASGAALLFFVASLILFVVFLHQVLNLLPDQRLVWLRPLILSVLFIGLYFLLSDRSILLKGVLNWRIFNPELFASEGVASSLGSLIIQLLFLFWACIYITNKVQIRINVPSHSVLNYVLHLVGYFIIFYLTIYTVGVISALVHDSKIQFALINPLQPDYFSLAAVVCIAIIFICLFLLSVKIISTLRRRALNSLDNAIVLLTCTTLAFIYYLVHDKGISGLWVMMWVNMLIIILPYFSIRPRGALNFARIFTLLVFVSASGAALLQVYSEKKEQDTRVNFAEKLITSGDAVTEFLLTDLQQQIPDDDFIINFFKSPQLAGKTLANRLQQLYFQEGFSRYEIHYYPFDKDGYLLPVAGEEFGFTTENRMKSGKKEVIKNQLYKYTSPSGTFSYLAQYPIKDNDSLLGHLNVQLTADAYKSAGVYPELLLEEKDKLPFVTPQYSYAIYNNQHLVKQSGNYFYDYRLRWISPNTYEEKYLDDGGSNHLLYNAGSNLIIVVSKENNWFSYFTSYFSFLFVVLFNITLLVLIFNIISIHPNLQSIRNFFRRASLRMLIHGFFMMFILTMLLIIAYVAGTFFLKQFNNLAMETVTDKMNRISKSIQFIYIQDSLSYRGAGEFENVLKKNIDVLAEVQDIDINFYDLHGDLVASSQRSFFEKGLISKKINPFAFHELSGQGQTVLVKEEQVGKLKFFSGYQSIRNSMGRPLVYIHLPYFNSKANLNEQVGFFFVALVNVLVLATILAGLLAPFISRQITKKLSLIGEKFKKVRVGSGNELIEWQANDEIGNLVSEYNKMIGELDASADKLAKSERELAWREMARQVAHEIKNPLTPMKLSIQHLQRAYEQNAPNLKEMTQRVCLTLIEQINNLSQIANEFSNFAKMPQPQVEVVNVNEVLNVACNLLLESEDVQVQLYNHADQNVVAADKNQLLSVFNNLILNAIQAIPDDRTGNVKVITQNTDGQIVISVSDNGVGISEEEGKKVFIPNFTTKSSGTGLGLAISKNIVESFGGAIHFSSEKNIGTTFFIELPLLKKENLN